ncbi:unnamed protein product [Plutella xylostella]|uniref:(diamondback moth) hypothetical protein n=1 Tax=Plutella xylostella TaxID=51655 RepID=A0A8S4G9C0_PLUXY|nr:unnamed protein product [Plutella xylostella]
MAEGIAVPGRWIHGNSCWLLRQGKLTEFSYARSYIYRGTRKGLYMYGRGPLPRTAGPPCGHRASHWDYQ